MMIQLEPPIPLDTPKGPGLATILIDYGAEHHLMWVTFDDATGECWTWPNPQIRAQKNVTMDRRVGPPKFPVTASAFPSDSVSDHGFAGAKGKTNGHMGKSA